MKLVCSGTLRMPGRHCNSSALKHCAVTGLTMQQIASPYGFVSTVADNFKRDGTIREKYNAATRSTDAAVKSGYQINVIGFGWTNAAFLEFLHQMPPAMVEKLAKQQAAK